jgi:KDO2-lipid IV(A) lauroyltransferase
VAVGRRLGRAVWYAHRSRRRLATDNARASLEVTPEQAQRIAGEAFAHFGRFFAECLALPCYAGPRHTELFRVEGLDHLRRATQSGRGAIVFSGHLGNWELVAQQQALAGHPLDFIARPMANPRVEGMLQGWREAVGNRVLSRRDVLRRAVRSLRHGRCVALLIDQHASSPPRVTVPFLGRPARTTASLGWLAARLDAPLIPVRSSPLPDGGYRIHYHPPIDTPNDGPLDERALEVTRRALALLEGWIREEPETWLWLHDRWKGCPPGEPWPRTALIEEAQ